MSLIVWVKVALAITENRTIVRVTTITAVAATLNVILRKKFTKPALSIRSKVINLRFIEVSRINTTVIGVGLVAYDLTVFDSYHPGASAG